MRACWLRGILLLGPAVSLCGALLTKNFHAPPPRRAFHTTQQQQQEQRNPSAIFVDLCASRYTTIRMPRSFLRMADDDSGEDGDPKDTKPERDDKKEEKLNLFNRFTSPIIDDPGLPLSDVLVAQVIAPSLQIAWLSLRHAPQPSWLKPIVDTDLLYSRQGTFVAPALIHGAALAFCWVVGALAARAYERRSISPVKAEQRQDTNAVGSSSAQEVEWDYSNVIKAILQGGAFATGLLIHVDAGRFVFGIRTVGAGG